jgi:hypothetical protein
MVRTLFFSALIALTSVSDARAVTVDQLFSICQRAVADQDGEPQTEIDRLLATQCAMYIEGFVKGYQVKEQESKLPKAVKVGFCPPKNASIGQIARVFVTKSSPRPDLFHYDAEVALAGILYDTFPCNQ